MGNVLVTGVTGQLGYYVASHLARRGERVFGLVRQTTKERVSGPLPYIPITGDLLDECSLLSVLREVQPDRLFNFGAQSYIPSSWSQPMLTAQYTGLGVVRLLEALRCAAPGCRMLQAGSSEMFSDAQASPQDESTPFCPTNPYGIAKAFAYSSVAAYRRRYGLFTVNAIFYTNESPRRSTEFVFRKVTHGVAAIVARERAELRLGNLDTVRDWGFAPEYAAIAAALLEQETPEDFVVATGEGHSVGELVERAFALVGLDPRAHVHTEPALVRPREPVPLIGSTDRLRARLKIDVDVRFDHLLRFLLAYDLRLKGLDVPFEVPRLKYFDLR